jgi:WD40-like Beta Propeller Repeat
MTRWLLIVALALAILVPGAAGQVSVGATASDYIAFVHQVSGGTYGVGEIWLMRSDGTDAHRLLPGDTSEVPRWSPDGQTLLYTREPTLYATTETAQSGRVVFSALCGVGIVHWSRQGRLAVNGCGDVYVSTAAGLRRLTRTRNEILAGWTRDGRSVVVLHGKPLRQFSIPASGGRPRAIAFPGFAAVLVR